MRNIDAHTVDGFGDEWRRFDHGAEAPSMERQFESYFRIFPFDGLGPQAEGADFGCGSGRWSRLMRARMQGRLHLIDAAEEALEVAKRNLSGDPGVEFHCGSFEEARISPASLDYGFSLGVLHHVPDTRSALLDIAKLLKPNAPFLLYLYYRFDNRPDWYRRVWQATDLARKGISRLPKGMRYAASQAAAVGIYWPLARSAKALERAGALPTSWPLAAYRDLPFYAMRTDALDRFGTRLEKRFTKAEIRALLESSGFKNVIFSDAPPYWCALARRSRAAVAT